MRWLIRPSSILKITIVIVANYSILTGANAQFTSQPKAAEAEPTLVACPAAADLAPLHLYGLWRAEFDGLAQGATLLFEKHTDFAESLSGAVNRDGSKTQLVGDIDNGTISLEESEDGQAITATWTGTLVAGSCAKQISGSWTAAADGKTYLFVLRKLPGWQ